MRVYKEYGLLNSKGVLFIIMKNADNKLFKLVSTDCNMSNRIYKPIKDIKGNYDMFEPTTEDYKLFIKTGKLRQA